MTGMDAAVPSAVLTDLQFLQVPNWGPDIRDLDMDNIVTYVRRNQDEAPNGRGSEGHQRYL